MEDKQTYAIVLFQDSKIVQIRNFHTTYDNAITHAKEYMLVNKNYPTGKWFNQVALYKTVDHVNDLLLDGEELADDEEVIVNDSIEEA